MKNKFLKISLSLWIATSCTLQAQITMEQADMIALSYRLQEIKGSYALYACRSNAPAFDIYEGLWPDPPSEGPVIHAENEYVFFIDEQPYPYLQWERDCRYLLINKTDGSYRVVHRRLPPYDYLYNNSPGDHYVEWDEWQFVYKRGYTESLSRTDSIALEFREKEFPGQSWFWKYTDSASPSIVLTNLAGDTILQEDNVSVYYWIWFPNYVQDNASKMPGDSSFFLCIDKDNDSCRLVHSTSLPSSFAYADSTWVMMELIYDSPHYPYHGFDNEPGMETVQACLYPNRPNPFHQTTLVRYYLPESVRKASLQVFVDGQTADRIRLIKIQ